MTGLQRFFKNIFSMAAAEALSKVISAAVLLYMVRVLTPAEFGILNFAQAMVAYLMIITNMGLDQVGTREISQNPDDRRRIVSTVLIIKSLQALVAFVLLVIFVLLIKEPLLNKSVVFIYGFMVFGYVLILDWFYQGIEKLEHTAVYRIICSLVSTAAIFAVVRTSQQLIYIPIIYMGATFAGIIYLAAIYRKMFGKLVFQWDRSMLKDYFRQSLVIGVTQFFLQLLYNFDLVLLNFYRTESEVGYYAAAYKLILFMIIPLSIFFQAMYPVLSRYYVESREKLQMLVRNINKLIPAVSFPLVIFGVFTAGPILELLFGKRYAPAIPIFKMLIFTLPVIYSNTLNARGLWVAKREGEYFWSIFIAAATNVITNFYFIPRYGMPGAALTSIFAEFVGSIYCYWAFKKYVLNESIFPWFWKPALASGVVVVYFLNVPDSFHIIPRTIVGAVIYVFFLQIQDFINRNDIEVLRNLHPALKRRNNNPPS